MGDTVRRHRCHRTPCWPVSGLGDATCGTFPGPKAQWLKHASGAAPWWRNPTADRCGGSARQAGIGDAQTFLLPV